MKTLQRLAGVSLPPAGALRLQLAHQTVVQTYLRIDNLPITQWLH